jgi:O-antigen/teichoic acid export membrane protein
MGIIQRQSIRSSVFIFIGFGIGALNMLVLFPKIFTPEQIGLTRIIMDTGLTLSTLASLGTLPVIYKFFPFYKSYLPPKKADLPGITFLSCLLGFVLVCVGGYFFKDLIIRKFGAKSPLFIDYFYLVFPFTFLMLFFVWMEGFSWSLKRTVVSNFLKETAIRLLTTLLILAVFFNWIDFRGFMNSFGFVYLLPCIALLMVLRKTGEWHFTFNISSVTRRLKYKMMGFALYIFGAQFLNVLSRTFDTFALAAISEKGLRDTAVFTIATYIVTLMEIPQRSLVSISVPVIAESWKNKDLDNIRTVYKKSVTNLMVMGLFVFGLLWLNIHNLSHFLGKEYAAIEGIVLLMGIGKIIDLGTGVNGQLIATSSYWRFDFFTNVIYTLLALPLNYILIKQFGLMGAAYANLIAVTIYNTIRFLFIWKKFGFQPYHWHNLFILLIGAGTYTLIYFLPKLSNIYFDSMLRGGLFILIFGSLIHFTRVAPDLSVVLQMLIGRVKRMIGR